MRLTSLLSVLFLTAVASAQMPATGDFYYTLSPRQATLGQTVTFEAFTFGMCLYSYNVTYTLLPTPISSKLTRIVNLVAKVAPFCATATGYSGPKATFKDLGVGVYILQFDSTSDYKATLGDTNRFEIVAPSMGLKRKESAAATLYEAPFWDGFRIDGRKALTQESKSPEK